MSEDKPIEEKIAAFLEHNYITIVPEVRGSREVFGYVQNRPGLPMVELGETTYNPRTGIADAISGENLRQRLQLKGFVTGVTRPMARLLRDVKGDFYHDRFDPIHDALDRLEQV